MTEEKGSKSVLRSFRKILDYGSLNPINGKNVIKERILKSLIPSIIPSLKKISKYTHVIESI